MTTPESCRRRTSERCAEAGRTRASTVRRVDALGRRLRQRDGTDVILGLVTVDGLRPSRAWSNHRSKVSAKVMDEVGAEAGAALTMAAMVR